MKAVYKYEVPVADEVYVDLPIGFRFLYLAVQNGVPCIWGLVDPRAKKVTKKLYWRGTGHPLEDTDTNPANHLGTVLIHGGSLVFHLFYYEDLP